MFIPWAQGLEMDNIHVQADKANKLPYPSHQDIHGHNPYSDDMAIHQQP